MEVCVDNVESAVNAAAGGASRLELCSALSEGGLTPTKGLLTIIKRLVSIPVFVMLRPRKGSDFVFSADELEAIYTDALVLREAGADGFVFGALTHGGDVDIAACRRVLEIASDKPVTFHRAFDVTCEPYGALETIIDLGFSRLLTSGQASSAEKGLELIKELILRARNRIIVMPGAGITIKNLPVILNETKAREFHGSARIPKQLVLRKINCSMASDDDSPMLVTSTDVVREMVTIFSSYAST
ncbi:copper homeostasis protein cutC homolog [Schistocerca nitens]|uniref:copper homeostasis protein cutC homolog n=1 Tax=Schistocerca nitens TaxID=7011 RepID=UPI00211867A8|nr:copper homeostasis protein cutC homolog [Schistocerca nitens]